MGSNICKHFGQCGGCSFQDIPYLEQLQRKEEKVKELIAAGGISTELKPINSYAKWFYRNKMEFGFSANSGLICGLYKKGNHREVVDIEECLIFSLDTGNILHKTKEFAKNKGYAHYNKFSYQGFLRNLVIRETKFTKEIMLGLVTTGQEALDKEGFVKALTSLKLYSNIKSIYHIVNNSWSDAVIFEKKDLLFGEPYIQEELGGLKFKIGIDSFFQTNPQGIKDLYAKIESCAGLTGNEKVLDLFCGAGGIGIFLSKRAKFVWGVELQKEIVEAAWQNAKINSIENISFLALDVRKFFNAQGSFHKDTEILVINPPRSGLSHKILRGILRLTPKNIFYSSCNPDTFFRDIKILSSSYKIKFIEPFDFFPHTAHLECLALLEMA
jgi:23S rRNA (uracil1939-C5)-methyltransferase